MYNGWVKLHRKLLDNPIANKPAYGWLWITLLLMANHEEKRIIWNNEIIIIKEGQLLTGLLALEKQTGIPKSTIDRILELLESGKQIGQQKTTKFRVITILNWKEYQKVGNGLGSKWETNGKQMGTNKNVKNDKNVKNIPLPSARREISFKKEDYDYLIEKYQILKGILLKGNEFKPVQQTIKTMFLSGRSREDIAACMDFFANSTKECWQSWTINTVAKQLPLFLNGKL